MGDNDGEAADVELADVELMVEVGDDVGLGVICLGVICLGVACTP